MSTNSIITFLFLILIYNKFNFVLTTVAILHSIIVTNIILLIHKNFIKMLIEHTQYKQNI
jgi:hypothetical protein